MSCTPALVMRRRRAASVLWNVLAAAAAVILPALLAATPNYIAPLPPGETLVSVAPAPSRDLVVASHRRVFVTPSLFTEGGWQDEAVLRLISPDGEPRAAFTLAGGRSVFVAAVAVQSDGRVVVAGRTNAGAFPLVEPLFPEVRTQGAQSAAGPMQGFVAILAADLSRILKSTLVGGSRSSLFGSTELVAVGLDAADRIFVAGNTGHSDLPSAPDGGALTLPFVPGNITGSWRGSEAFVMGFDRNLSRFEFSTMLGVQRGVCVGGSSCFVRIWGSAIDRFVVSPEGIVTILSTGTAVAPSPGKYNLSHHFPPPQLTVLASPSQLIRVDARNRSLLWAMDAGYLVARQGSPFPPDRPRGPARMAVHPAGTVFLALLNEWSEDGSAALRPLELNLLQISADGSALLQRDVLGGDAKVSLDSFLLDRDGNCWLAGPAGFPAWEPMPPESRSGSQYLLRFHARSREVHRYLLLPHGTTDLQLVDGQDGQIWVVGKAGVLQAFQRDAPVSTAILGAANSAGFTVTGRLSPGEMLSLYGKGFGPASGQGATVGEQNRLPFSLNGVEVFANGLPCPLLYASGEQVNLIAPFWQAAQVAGGEVMLELRYGGLVRLRARLAPTLAQPHVFARMPVAPDPAQALPVPEAIIQVAGRSPETADNPLRPGDVFTLWMNGAGSWQQAVLDGELAAPPYKRPRLSLRASLGPAAGSSSQQELIVEYFGAAPGYAAGLLQVNLRIPTDANLQPGGNHRLRLAVGEDGPEGFTETAAAPDVLVRAVP